MPAVRLPAGGISLRKQQQGLKSERNENGTISWYDPDERTLQNQLAIPCGKCLGCRMAKAREWALRCHLEQQDHEEASFATLTYNDKSLPPTLEKRHLQLWLKRIRKALGPARPIRFFASGEYGEQTARPHYHAILYGIDEYDRELVEQTWGLGNTRLEQLTPARISYCAGYTAKKIGFPGQRREQIDYSTGEVYTWQPPFIQMSRRPGIGGNARRHINSWRLYAIHNGTRMPVPRFLHEAWKKQATEEQIEQLEIEKKTLRRYNTPLTRQAAEKIAEKTHELQTLKRKYA